MANFMIRFFICNVFISGIIGILLIVKRIFKNSLSSRMQYNLWFLLLGYKMSRPNVQKILYKNVQLVCLF